MRRFNIVAMVLSFIVDIAAFLHLFGIEIVFSASPASPSLQSSPVSLKQPVFIEAITFLLWLYGSIILLLLIHRLTYSNPLPILILSMVPALMLLVWLWGFGYIARWLYILCVPVAGFISMAWLAASAVHQAYNRALIILSLVVFGLTVLWFRTSLSWSFPLIVVYTVASCFLGNGLGYSLGEQEFKPVAWLAHGVEAFRRS